MIIGDPDPKHISTSCVERANLTDRVWDFAEIVTLMDQVAKSE